MTRSSPGSPSTAAGCCSTGDVDVPGLDMGALEKAAVPWSYAAALAIGIDPALVFHEGGYRGHSPGLDVRLRRLPRRRAGAGFPRMRRWLREA